MHAPWSQIADGAFWFPGLILSIREATYSVITIICAIIQPSFLLVDTVSSFPDDGGKRAIMLYAHALFTHVVLPPTTPAPRALTH